MKRVLMAVLGGVLVASVAADGPHDEGEAPERAGRDGVSEGNPPRVWVFRGPGGDCRTIPILGGVTIDLDNSGAPDKPGGLRRTLPISSWSVDTDGRPCPEGYVPPWRRGGER